MLFNLGEHKLHFIPALIGPFLEVTLIPQADLRNVMIPIFHDMMDWEQRRSGNFKQVSRWASQSSWGKFQFFSSISELPDSTPSREVSTECSRDFDSSLVCLLPFVWPWSLLQFCVPLSLQGMSLQGSSHILFCLKILWFPGFLLKSWQRLDLFPVGHDTEESEG